MKVLHTTVTLTVLLAGACANHDIPPQVQTGYIYSTLPDPVTGVRKPVVADVATRIEKGEVRETRTGYTVFQMVHGSKIEPGVDNNARAVATAQMMELQVAPDIGPAGEEVLKTLRQAQVGPGVAAASDENSKVAFGLVGQVLHGVAIGGGAAAAGYFIGERNNNDNGGGGGGAFSFATAESSSHSGTSNCGDNGCK